MVDMVSDKEAIIRGIIAARAEWHGMSNEEKKFSGDEHAAMWIIKSLRLRGLKIVREAK